MNQWSFVIAAYVVTALATLGLLGWSFAAMRRAEGATEAVKRGR